MHDGRNPAPAQRIPPQTLPTPWHAGLGLTQRVLPPIGENNAINPSIQGPSCPFLRSYVFVRFPGPHKVCNKVSLQSRLLFVQGRLGNDRYPSDHALESISIILCLFFIYFFSRIPPSLNAAPTAICYPSKGVYLEHTAYLCMPFRLVIQKCRSPPTGSKIMPWIPMRRNLFPTSLELLFSSALFSCLSNL